jgi:ATP-binding cassette subfamily F protein 3
LLILDEPTNHLDIEARAALIEAVNDYPGAVILVSHDRHLLEACADRLWLVSNGTVKPYESDLDQYRRDVLGASGAERMSGKEKRAANAGGAKKPSLGNINKKIAALESQVQKLEEDIAMIDMQLSDASLHQRDPKKAAALAEQRAIASDTLGKTEAEWLELSSEREAMGA